MTEALTKTSNPDERMRIAAEIASGGNAITSLSGDLETAAKALDVPMGELAALLNDPNFMKVVRDLSTAKASLALHAAGVQNVIEILQTGDNKEKLTAFKLLGMLTGELKNNHQVAVKVSFDELHMKADREAKADPLGGLFEIGQVIDAETEDSDEEHVF